MTAALSVTTHTISGRDGAVRVRDYAPATSDPTATPLLWVHGGGFSSGGLDQKESDAPARILAAHGRHVRTIDYRLVPAMKNPFGKAPQVPHANQFPAALHDVVDTAIDLGLATGMPIAIGGASAGACISAAATLYLRDQKFPAPTTVILAYGIYHATLPTDPEVEAELKGVSKLFFRAEMVRQMNLNYVRHAEQLTPGYAFPGGADLTSLPPTLMLDAKNDRLRASGTAFAQELENAGTDVRHVVVDGGHAFLDALTSRGFALGVRTIREWLEKHDPDAGA